MRKKTTYFTCFFYIVLLFANIIQVSALTPVYNHTSTYKASKYYTDLCNVQLTGNYIDDLVNVALSQEGYHEGNSKNDYDGGNTWGSDNYCEYNNNYYGKDNHVKWCAIFVSWCARQARIPQSIIPNFAGCTTGYKNLFPDCGAVSHVRKSLYVPKKGDIIFFDWSKNDGSIYHVGIVTEDSNGSTVTYIDGNGSDDVSVQNTKLTDTDIYGYQTPNYQESFSYIKIKSPANESWIDPDESLTVSWTSLNGAKSYRYSVAELRYVEDGSGDEWNGSYRKIDYYNSMENILVSSGTSITFPAKTFKYEGAYKIWVGGCLDASGNNPMTGSSYIYIHAIGNNSVVTPSTPVISYPNANSSISGYECTKYDLEVDDPSMSIWYDSENAVKYNYSIKQLTTDPDPTNENEGVSLDSGVTPNSSINIPSPAYGTWYKVGIQAISSTGHTSSWKVRYIRTASARPSITQPSSETTINADDSITFKWNSGTNNSESCLKFIELQGEPDPSSENEPYSRIIVNEKAYSGNTYTASNLTAGKYYKVIVKARNTTYSEGYMPYSWCATPTYIYVQESTPPSISVTSISLNTSQLSLTVGQTSNLTATVSPRNATNRAVTWSSSNNSVATVSSSGVVTAKSAGSATITATAKDGSGASGSCAVTVTAGSSDPTVNVTDIRYDDYFTDMHIGESCAFTPNITPSTATNSDLTWSSSYPEIASVDANGKVTAHALGSTTISASSADGSVTRGCYVTVFADGSMDDFEVDANQLIGYSGTAKNVVIPDTIKINNKSGQDVYRIANSLFENNTNIETIVLPHVLKYIGDYAFRDCSSLKRADIPNGVISIGNQAFDGCSSLTTVNIPQTLTSGISVSTFKNCTALTGITVETGNTNYTSDYRGVLFDKEKTFMYHYPGGNKSTEYTLPSETRTIASYALTDCLYLKTLYIHKNLEVIRSNGKCNSITDIYYEGTESEWNAVEGYSHDGYPNATVHFNYSPDNPSHDDAYDIISISAPNGNVGDTVTVSVNVNSALSVIGGKFNINYDNDKLELLGIEKGDLIKNITVAINENYTDSSARITFSSANEFTADGNIIKLNFRLLNVGTASIDTGDFKFGKSDGQYIDVAYTTCEINIGNTPIGGDVIASGTDANGIKWTLSKAGVLTITGTGEMADYANTASIPWYSYKQSVSSISVSDGITHIASRAFYGCINTKRADIPNSVVTIGDYAFRNCDEMTIYGYGGSYAEEYANAYNIPFVRKDSQILKQIEVTDHYSSSTKWYFDIVTDELAEKSKIYVGIYDNEGVLLSVSCEDYNIGETELTVSARKTNSDYQAKIFIWDSGVMPRTYAEAIGLQ